MTSSQAPAPPSGPERRWLREASDRVARWVSGGVQRYDTDGLDPGELAKLRRLSPSDPSSASFWKVLAGLDDLIELPSSTRALKRVERRWAAFFNAAAILSGLSQRSPPLGRALFEAGFSELRLVRLLRASADALHTEVRQAARFLAAKGQAVDLYGLASLIFSDDTNHQEATRRHIARAYYQHFNRSDDSKEN